MAIRSITCAAIAAGLLCFAAQVHCGTGAALFTAHCAVCHQAGAQGIPGMYPPLADSVAEFARTRDGRAYLVHVLSFGLSGPISVHGGHYNGFMQSWAQLSNEDIAQLLNYVLTGFNAKLLPARFTPFSAGEVRRDRARPMTSAEVYRELQRLTSGSVKADAMP